MATYTSFKELDCYQKSRDAKIWIIAFLKTIPKNEYDMKDNFLRAARSMTRNIAEGFGRFHFKENIQYVRIARDQLQNVKMILTVVYWKDFAQEKKYKKAIDYCLNQFNQ